MREFNYDVFEAQEPLIRLRSDNYDCYVDKATYHKICLQMSSGDYGSHKAILVHVCTNRIDELELIRYDEDNQGFWFQSKGDCFFEGEL